MADDRALRDLSFWTLGSLSGASWQGIGAALPFLGVGMLCLCFLASSLNALLLGEADAFHLGADVQRAKHLALLGVARSEEHTSELQSLMRISYAVFCLKKQKT